MAKARKILNRVIAPLTLTRIRLKLGAVGSSHRAVRCIWLAVVQQHERRVIALIQIICQLVLCISEFEAMRAPE